MTISLFWSDKLKCPHAIFLRFVQGMANRWLQGHARYGLPNASKAYHSRMKLELKAYTKTGNAEHLYNLANYCALEFICPQHPKHHENNRVGSVTRGIL